MHQFRIVYVYGAGEYRKKTWRWYPLLVCWPNVLGCRPMCEWGIVVVLDTFCRAGGFCWGIVSDFGGLGGRVFRWCFSWVYCWFFYATFSFLKDWIAFVRFLLSLIGRIYSCFRIFFWLRDFFGDFIVVYCRGYFIVELSYFLVLFIFSWGDL